MNIHEYQAKSLLTQFGILVPKGKTACNVNEAVAAATYVGGSQWVVKAQIHAGGRGKGGGVKIVDSIQQLKLAAKEILGMKLISPQTGNQGKTVKQIYIEERCNIKKELYLGLLVDQSISRVMIIASTEGGVDIEEIASNKPDQIIKISVDPAIGLHDFYARKLAFGLGLSGIQLHDFINFLQSIYRLFIELDVSILEINPLVIQGDGKLIALDSKMNFDQSALYRHPDLLALRDINEEDPIETTASNHGLNYVKLDGSIGCMVNGAGLAMATMDIIQLYGGSPANFLDVGGDATKERVKLAFKIILSDPKVKGILVNIFGGIIRCNVIAEAIVEAAKAVKLNIPLVVRLDGTSVNHGKQILKDSRLPIVSADNVADATKTVINEVKNHAIKEDE